MCDRRKAVAAPRGQTALARSQPSMVSEVDDATQERLRLGEAARAALAEAEGRWRRERGAAAQEQMRLRAEIQALTQRRSNPIVPTERDGDAPAAKRARLNTDPTADASLAALSRTEVYAMYHSSEESLQAERGRRVEAEEQLTRLLTELEAQLPVYKDRSERLKSALESNARLSEKLGEASLRNTQLKDDVSRLNLEVSPRLLGVHARTYVFSPLSCRSHRASPGNAGAASPHAVRRTGGSASGSRGGHSEGGAPSRAFGSRAQPSCRSRRDGDLSPIRATPSSPFLSPVPLPPSRFRTSRYCAPWCACRASLMDTHGVSSWCCVMVRDVALPRRPTHATL